MTEYGAGFAKVYNERWAGFARHVTPIILDFFERTSGGGAGKSVLDLCCGTGQFAAIALDRGYRVTGIDLSPHMLHHARANCAGHAAAGTATFVEGDVRTFTVPAPFDLAVATYDALNHLSSYDDLAAAFRAVHAAVAPGGTFIFDLNTRKRLQQWTGVMVTDTEELMMIDRGMYLSDVDQAVLRITGFIRRPDGLYERFAEVHRNTAFTLADVLRLLAEAGWAEAHCAALGDLGQPVANPEELDRAWVVARRGA